MRKTLATASLLIASTALLAQTPFPTCEKEDRGKIMSSAYWKLWNKDVQKKIDADIEQNRKATASISLGDVKAGTAVKVEQISHDFVFGAHIFNYNQLGTKERNQRYKNLWGTLFNRATVAFYWNKFEMTPGRKRYREEYWDTEEYWNSQKEPKKQPHWRRPSADQIVEFCESKGVAVHGHPIIWGSRQHHFPYWIYDELMDSTEKKELLRMMTCRSTVEHPQDSDRFTQEYYDMTPLQLERKFPKFTTAFKQLFDQRICELARYYGKRISSWDVVNESAIDFARGNMIAGDKFCKSYYGPMPGDYTFESFMTAGKAFPKDVLLNINDYWRWRDYNMQIKDLLRRGAPIKAIGSQMHLFNPQQILDIAAGVENQTPKQIWEKMDGFSENDLPIYISEITIMTPDSTLRGRQMQATIAYNMYRIWFSVKNMRGVTWWNVVDDCGNYGEPTLSGLFTRDMQPKPAFYALDRLINHEWKTNTVVKADENGSITFRGFKGMYRITWTGNDGKEHTTEYHLK